ncbi:MAG: glycoside hydrolase [Longimicrobiales bacterium]
MFDPRDANTIYAALWESRQGPWENGVFTGPGSGIQKSTDGGNTWRALTNGLPPFADGLGRIGITVAPSDPRRLYATIEVRGQGQLYRSDDAGERWYRVNTDQRVASRPSDFAEVKVDPTNPDIVYTGSIVAWRSADGGRTFQAFRGAPGGDDYHRVWINPRNPRIILLATDQGAIITVNGGETFSSWYNQPTAQFYHVSTDNAFPYRVCGGQQESGSVCIQSRGDDGQITFREWHPVGVEEYGYVAADPLNPDIVYGGKVTRYDRRTGQVQNVAPKPIRPSDYRTLRTAPVVFSTVDPQLLFFASNTLWKTTTGGQSWQQISPDLTRRDSIVPASVGTYSNSPTARARHPGVIYTIAPSYLKSNIIWVGSDDGLMHVTFNGGRSWKDVTPAELKARPWSKISVMDASHFDTLTAYAAVNTLRIDDLRPHIFRTRDGGKTWQHIAKGIPDGGTINAVREDPKRKGLLFAGSEQAVYVSFDDGENWSSLRLNMPATSIRDLVIKDDDIVVGTHGRSFWILDDITPLRQLTSAVRDADVHLYRPQSAIRFRWNKNTDTPLPQEEPAGQNPPDGAIINYWLKAPARTVTLDLLDAGGRLVRSYSSEDPPEPMLEGVNVPPYWVRPPQVLVKLAGMHRFVWDLHYAPPAGANFSYPIAAIYRNTPRVPHGPWAAPGTYTVRLNVDGRQFRQPLTVRMDPRVTTSVLGLQEQQRVSMQLYDGIRKAFAAQQQVRDWRAQLRRVRERAPADLASALDSMDTRLAGLDTGTGDNLGRLHADLSSLLNLMQGADVAPSTQARTAATERVAALERLLARVSNLRSAELVALNAQLRAAGLPVLTLQPVGDP